MDESPDLTQINSKRHITIHKLNYYMPVDIHLGKITIPHKFTKFHFNFKVGQFSTTKKPFYFRSKKKRYC